jgi:TM2 domain-containing membrane protein YozV
MSNRVMSAIPGLEMDEIMYLEQLTKDLSDDELRSFGYAYSVSRKDPQTILLTCLIGLLGIAGIHRFLINQVGMGILYFFTAGLCYIGTIVDAVNYKKLAQEYNQQRAMECYNQIRMFRKP